MVIGISGRICAGKTTTAHILEQHGFAYTRFSLVIDAEIMVAGGLLDRATRQRIGMEINQTKGQRWLCEKVLELAVGKELVAVDGLRFPEDHAFFVERFGSEFLHFHIVARQKVRADRYGRSEYDGVAFEVADARPVENRIDELKALANTVLKNEATIQELEQNVLKHVDEFSRGTDTHR